jgi:hypothetical protein
MPFLSGIVATTATLKGMALGVGLGLALMTWCKRRGEAR